jgi:hypothetical protein
VAASRSALEVFTKANLPLDWAASQNSLGLALYGLGTRGAGDEGRKMLQDAVNAYRSALEVRTKVDLPQDWAQTQNNLSDALEALGNELEGQEGLKRRRESVELLRDVMAWIREHSNHTEPQIMMCRSIKRSAPPLMRRASTFTMSSAEDRSHRDDLGWTYLFYQGWAMRHMDLVAMAMPSTGAWGPQHPYCVALSGLPSRTNLHNQRAEHLLPRGQKERCTVQRRHSYVTPQFCNSPHRKRRGTTRGVTVDGPCKPDDYGALPACDRVQARLDAFASGSHRYQPPRPLSAGRACHSSRSVPVHGDR